MADELRVMLETGPKGKKVVAVAPDWPGLERGAKTGEAAIERLRSYLPRYAQVAKLAGMDAEFAAITTTDVVEHYAGTGSTDFWGISFAFSGIDTQGMSSEELARELTLMWACWAFFDEVRSRVSAELQQGPCERRRKNGTNVGIKVGQWVGVVTAYRGPAEESWEKGVTTHGTQYRPFASQAREEPAPDRERAGPQ